MKGYRYYHKKKNLKLRYFFLFLAIGFVVYIVINNIGELPFFKFHEKKVATIKKELQKFDSLTNRTDKKVLIQKVVKNLLKLSREDSDNYMLLYLLGEAYLRKGFLEYNKELRNMYIDKAIYFLRKSLALYNGDNLTKGKLHFELGMSYFYKGTYYYYESLIELKTAKKYGYKNKKIDKIISFIKFRKGNYSEINELINNFKGEKKGSIEKYFYNGYLYKNKGEYEKAKENLHMVEMYFEDKENKNEEDRYMLEKTYYGLGWLYYNDGDYEKAEEYYKKSLELAPDNADIYYWLGKVYIALGDKKKAKKMLQQAQKLDSANVNIKRLIKKIKRMRGKRR